MTEHRAPGGGILEKTQLRVFLHPRAQRTELPLPLLLVHPIRPDSELDVPDPPPVPGIPADPTRQALPGHIDLHLLGRIVDGLGHAVRPVLEGKGDPSLETAACMGTIESGAHLAVQAPKVGARKSGLGSTHVPCVAGREASPGSPVRSSPESPSHPAGRTIHGGPVGQDSPGESATPLPGDVVRHQVDHPAEGTGSVEKARRSPNHFGSTHVHRVQSDGVIGGRFGKISHPLSVLQNQDSVAVEAPDDRARRSDPERPHGHPALPIEDGAHGGIHPSRQRLSIQGLRRLIGHAGRQRGGCGHHLVQPKGTGNQFEEEGSVSGNVDDSGRRLEPDGLHRHTLRLGSQFVKAEVAVPVRQGRPDGT